jgi:hypothetical protein
MPIFLTCSVLDFQTFEHKNLRGKMFDATGRSPVSYHDMDGFRLRKYDDFEAGLSDPHY